MIDPQGSGKHRAGVAGSNRRRRGRVRVVGFQSSLGEIADISASGFRVKTRLGPITRPGGTLALVLDTPRGPIEVDVRVAWWKRVGWFRYEAGMEFEGIRPEVRAAIAELAKAQDDPA
jgi:PilZ domain